MLKKIAYFVTKNLFQTSTKKELTVQKVVVQEIGEREVFDIMVKDKHEYTANGLLVHNCIDALRYSLAHYR